MEFVGNYKSWIKQEWIDYLLMHDGIKRPGSGNNPDAPEFKQALDAGYDLTQTYWHHYTNISCTFDVLLPIDIGPNLAHELWFIKLMPGQFLPVHRDIISNGFNTRYWMAMQDYEPGHIFICDKFLLTDYKAGDLWKYKDASALHCACNIGYSPRLTFQFTTYDSN